MLDYKTIFQQIRCHDVVSFDIFDTLILRPFLFPRDLWIYIEKNYRLDGFYQSRIRCDADDNATIDDQYQNMPNNMQYIKQIECQYEIDLTLANEQTKRIYEFAKAQNKIIIISSDMYLSKDTIKQILSKTGFEYDNLYLSNDIKASKSNGLMFQQIKKDYPTQKILHIGDNAHSDIQMAKANGIDTIHIENACSAIINRHPFLLKFLQQHNTLENRTFIACIAQMAYNYEASFPIASYWSTLGEIIGTAITVLMLQFISKYIIDHKTKNIIFIGRDGYILKDVFDALDVKDVQTHYMYSPRNKTNLTDSQWQSFQDYVKAFNIKGSCLVIDMTTQKFSAKNKISKALGYDIDELAFITTDSNDATKSIVCVPQNSFWLCMLIECLFRAPEFPITSINNRQPIYDDSINMFELFFVETANQMLNIQRKCAIPTFQMLEQLNMHIDGKSYVNFLLLFMTSLSKNEKVFFRTLKHMSDGIPMSIIPEQLLN